MGEHVPSRRSIGEKRRKSGFQEEIQSKRSQRVSFKKYVQELEEDLLQQELDDLDDELPSS